MNKENLERKIESMYPDMLTEESNDVVSHCSANNISTFSEIRKAVNELRARGVLI